MGPHMTARKKNWHQIVVLLEPRVLPHISDIFYLRPRKKKSLVLSREPLRRRVLYARRVVRASIMRDGIVVHSVCRLSSESGEKSKLGKEKSG